MWRAPSFSPLPFTFHYLPWSPAALPQSHDFKFLPMLPNLPAASNSPLNSRTYTLYTYLGCISTCLSTRNLTLNTLYACLGAAGLPISVNENSLLPAAHIEHSVVRSDFFLLHPTSQPSLANAVSSTFAMCPEFYHFSLLPPLLPRPLSHLTQVIGKGLLPGLPIYTQAHPQPIPQTATKRFFEIYFLSHYSSVQSSTRLPISFRVNSSPPPALGGPTWPGSWVLPRLLLSNPASRGLPGFLNHILQAFALALPPIWKVVPSNLSLPY